MRLTAKARRGLRDSAFAGPNRSYPVHDRSHAVAAKAFSTRAFNAGRMSASQRKAIHTKANRRLGLRRG